LALPVLDAGGVHHQLLLAALGVRVVVAQALDELAVARGPAFGRHDVVERTLLGAGASQTNLHHVFKLSAKLTDGPRQRARKHGILAGGAPKIKGFAHRHPPGACPARKAATARCKAQESRLNPLFSLRLCADGKAPRGTGLSASCPAAGAPPGCASSWPCRRRPAFSSFPWSARTGAGAC